MLMIHQTRLVAEPCLKYCDIFIFSYFHIIMITVDMFNISKILYAYLNH
jgi:hypothetical protein